MRLNLVSLSLLIVVFFIAGCNSKELARLQSENDSLRSELSSRYNVLTGLKDVRSLLDSIDKNRNSLRTHLSEGTSFEDFSTRLKDINEFVKMSEEKIILIQNALKNSKHESGAYLMLVDALKGEVQIRVDEIIKLEEEVGKYKAENKGLKRTKLAPNKKRETYKEALELYKRSLSLGKKEAKADIANLEKKVK